MIHLEAGTEAKFDVENRPEAFRKALHLLEAGHKVVNIWLWGQRNMPVKVTRKNFKVMRGVHGK